MSQLRRLGSLARRIWPALGPGLITGAADDDAAGIATYSVAGAQLGTGLLGTALVAWPLMAGVQTEPAVSGESASDVLVGVVHSGKFVDQTDHAGIELCEPVRAEKTEVRAAAQKNHDGRAEHRYQEGGN